LQAKFRIATGAAYPICDAKPMPVLSDNTVQLNALTQP